jgi:Mn2+/Fe2+ NRAMP family transporter
MKSILIAAGIVGAAAAGVILYLRSRETNTEGANEIKGAAKNAYKTMNKGIGKVERLGQHSMG